MKKLIVNSSLLKPALSKLGQAINPKVTIPILTHLYCKVIPNQIEFIATNMEITIFYRLECTSAESFDFLVPFELFNKIVGFNKNCPLEISVSKTIKITANGETYVVNPGGKLEEFPTLQELPKKNSIEINQDILSCLHLAVVTTGIMKPVFEHVLLELSAGKITVASTDGSYMVFSKEFESDQQGVQELLLTQKVIKVLEGWESAKAFYHAKAIGFVSDNITVISTRSEDKFVNYRAIFPAEWPANLKLDRNSLVEKLNKCSLSTDTLHQTKIVLEKNTEIRLLAEDSVVNIDLAMAASYSGSIPSVTVNSEKLLKLLSQINTEDIEMAIHDAKRAIVITTDDSGYKGLIMPIAHK